VGGACIPSRLLSPRVLSSEQTTSQRIRSAMSSDIPSGIGAAAPCSSGACMDQRFRVVYTPATLLQAQKKQRSTLSLSVLSLVPAAISLPASASFQPIVGHFGQHEEAESPERQDEHLSHKIRLHGPPDPVQMSLVIAVVMARKIAMAYPAISFPTSLCCAIGTPSRTALKSQLFFPFTCSAGSSSILPSVHAEPQRFSCERPLT